MNYGSNQIIDSNKKGDATHRVMRPPFLILLPRAEGEVISKTVLVSNVLAVKTIEIIRGYVKSLNRVVPEFCLIVHVVFPCNFLVRCDQSSIVVSSNTIWIERNTICLHVLKKFTSLIEACDHLWQARRVGRQEFISPQINESSIA